MAEFCWRKTGVGGDFSCERLAHLAHCRNCEEYARAGRSLFDRPIPDGAREACARELAEPALQAPSETISVVIFRIGREWFALPTALFHEAVAPRRIHTVPGRANRVFRGLANVNGELLLAFSLAAAAGLAESGEAQAACRACVVGRAAERIVFEAAEILGVRRIPAAGLNAPPVTVSKSPAALSKAMFEADGRVVALIDDEKMFSALFGSLA